VNIDPVFGPPARSIAVAGSLVGYAAEAEGDGYSPDVTIIRIADVRHRSVLDPTGEQRWGLSMLLPDGEPAKVGSLAIDRHRRAAWIQCPDDGNEELGDARPNCVHPGDNDTVRLLPSPYAKRPGTRGIADPVDIAIGRDIDPRSIRLTSTRVAWTQAGRTHTRRLPSLMAHQVEHLPQQRRPRHASR
jgi:hypothetical protein